MHVYVLNCCTAILIFFIRIEYTSLNTYCQTLVFWFERKRDYAVPVSVPATLIIGQEKNNPLIPFFKREIESNVHTTLHTMQNFSKNTSLELKVNIKITPLKVSLSSHWKYMHYYFMNTWARLIGNYLKMLRTNENVDTSADPSSIPVPQANTATKSSSLIWYSNFFSVSDLLLQAYIILSI